MKVTPVSKSLSDLFKESFIQIPRFQRPYDWTNENVSDFWNDLINHDDDEYFMGSIVVYRDTKEKNLLYVVDGQQRLTTISIFLAVIRDEFDKSGSQDLATAVQGYIQTSDDDNKQRYVIVHNPAKKLFQHGIQNRNPDLTYEASDDEERAFLRARVALRDYVRAHIAGKSVADTVSLLRKMRQKALAIQFISVELDNEDDAYVIFEVLNTRGKDLRISHLLKNLLTKHLKAKVKGADPFKDKWDRIVSLLDGLKGSYDIDSFLFHYWLAHESSVAKARLFKEYKEKIGSKKEAEDCLNDLSLAAPSYLRAVAAKDQSWDKEEKPLSKSLEALSIFRVAQAMPLVLAILRLYFEDYIKLKHATLGIRLIENFTFQFNAITQSRGGGGISNMYAKLAQDSWSCGNAADFQDVLKSMKEKFSDRLPSIDEFSLPFSQIIYRNDYTRDKDLVRYILQKLQIQFGWPQHTDFDVLTVEHIVNQSDGNRTGGPDDCGAIGNLLLVSEDLNKKLGTKPPVEKLAVLSKAQIKLDDDLGSAKNWTYQNIVDRGGALAKIGYEKVWNL